TEVEYTPGSFQNAFSAPQKHPSPNRASSLPSGNGGTIRLPLTWWRSGTGIGSRRPGSASSRVGMSVFFLAPNMGWPSLGPILQTHDGWRGIRSRRPVDTAHCPPHSAGSMAKPQTIRDLRNSGWQRKSVKQEMRDNLIARLKRGEAFLPGIV